MKALQRRTLLAATAVLATVGLAATAIPAQRRTSITSMQMVESMAAR
jgi:hypothetical protein